uniref:Uncharacterized protein n=1 Tax=Anguilla anguilla TaxID=7936 RepID=A0A0E9R2F6_ANGAN
MMYFEYQHFISKLNYKHLLRWQCTLKLTILYLACMLLMIWIAVCITLLLQPRRTSPRLGQACNSSPRFQ